jgi:hypothetical protein
MGGRNSGGHFPGMLCGPQKQIEKHLNKTDMRDFDL